MSERTDPGGGRARVARRLVVRGRVQGVFFRGSTRERAEELRVAGWVANRPDGTVEAWLEGDSASVGTLEAWIRDGGPPLAVVTEVSAQDVAPRGHSSFDVVG